MRDFDDSEGRTWSALVREEPGTDYKGRYYLVMRPADGDDELELTDIRWNSERTARRTLSTMSVVELRRRLRQAVGRRVEPGGRGAQPVAHGVRSAGHRTGSSRLGAEPVRAGPSR